MSPKDQTPEAYRIGELAGSTVRGAGEVTGLIIKGVGSVVAGAAVRVMEVASETFVRDDPRNVQLRDGTD